MTLLVDASIVVAALIDTGPVGAWAEARRSSPDRLPPRICCQARWLPGEISADTASLAHHDLLSLPLELFAYSTCAERVRELWANVTVHDAWYAALTETLGASLATLDVRLSRAAGPRCDVVPPPA